MKKEIEAIKELVAWCEKHDASIGANDLNVELRFNDCTYTTYDIDMYRSNMVRSVEIDIDDELDKECQRQKFNSFTVSDNLGSVKLTAQELYEIAHQKLNQKKEQETRERKGVWGFWTTTMTGARILSTYETKESAEDDYNWALQNQPNYTVSTVRFFSEEEPANV